MIGDPLLGQQNLLEEHTRLPIGLFDCMSLQKSLGSIKGDAVREKNHPSDQEHKFSPQSHNPKNYVKIDSAAR